MPTRRARPTAPDGPLVGHQRRAAVRCRRRHIGLGATRIISLGRRGRAGAADECAPRAIMRQHQVLFQRPSSRPSSSSAASGRPSTTPWRRDGVVAVVAVSAGAGAGRAARLASGPVRSARAPGGATGGPPPPTRLVAPRRHRRDRPQRGRRQGVELVPHAPQLTSVGRRTVIGR